MVPRIVNGLCAASLLLLAPGCSNGSTFNDSAFDPSGGVLVAIHGPRGDCLGFTGRVTSPVRVVVLTPGYNVQARPLGIVGPSGLSASVGQTISVDIVSKGLAKTGCGQGHRRVILDGNSIVVQRKST
jgi:hypothetical protein